jgi:hypothetical protein
VRILRLEDPKNWFELIVRTLGLWSDNEYLSLN